MGAFVNNVEDMTLEIKICSPTNKPWTCSATVKNFYTENLKKFDFVIVPPGRAVEGETVEKREEAALSAARDGYLSACIRCKNMAGERPGSTEFFNASADFFSKLFSGEKEIKTIVVHED